MIHFLADEDFNNDILRGLMRRLPDVDLIRVQDAELSGADDDTVLSWSAHQKRAVLTHDVNTLIARAFERIKSGLGTAGVIAVGQSLPIGAVIQDLMLIAECATDDECWNRVLFLPLR
jgi:hypothetical protein